MLGREIPPTPYIVPRCYQELQENAMGEADQGTG